MNDQLVAQLKLRGWSEQAIVKKYRLRIRPETHLLPSDYWRNNERAKLLWEACLKSTAKGSAFDRIYAGIRLVINGEEGLRQFTAAWVIGAEAANVGISFEQITKILGNHQELARESVAASFKIKGVSQSLKNAIHDQREILRRVWGADPAKRFESTEVALKVAMLAGWLAFTEAHLTTVQAAVCIPLNICEQFLINLLVQEVEGLGQTESNEVIAHFFSSQYCADEKQECNQIVKAVGMSVELAREKNWDARSFVLDGQQQGRNLAQINPEGALIVMAEVGVETGVNRMIKILSGLAVQNICDITTPEQLVAALFEWYPPECDGWTLWLDNEAAGLITLRESYDFAFWVGLLLETSRTCSAVEWMEKTRQAFGHGPLQSQPYVSRRLKKKRIFNFVLPPTGDSEPHQNN